MGVSMLSWIRPCKHLKTLMKNENITLQEKLPLHTFFTVIRDAIEKNPDKRLLVNFNHFNVTYLTVFNFFKKIQSHCQWHDSVYYLQTPERQIAPVIFNCLQCAFTCDNPDDFIEHHTKGIYAPDHILEIEGKTNSLYFMKTIISTFKKTQTAIYNPHERQATCRFCDRSMNKNMKELYIHATEKHGRLIVPIETTKANFYNVISEKISAFYATLTNEQYHACYQCTSLFDNISDFLIHLQFVPGHENLIGYCSICKTDNEIPDIQHIYTHHRNEIKCPFLNCGYRTEHYESSLKDHLFTHNITTQKYPANFFNYSSYMDIIKFIQSSQDRQPLNAQTPIKFMGRMADVPYEVLNRQTDEQTLPTPPKFPIKGYKNSNTALDIVRSLSLHIESLHDNTKEILKLQIPRMYHIHKVDPTFTQSQGKYQLFGQNQCATIDDPHPLGFNRNIYPILLYGNNILKNVKIFQEGHQISLNITGNTTRFWPSYIRPETNETIIAHMEGQCESNFRKDYFTNLTNQLYGIKDYQGILFVEANIQDILSPTGMSSEFIQQLALSFIHGLTRLFQTPKLIVVIGAISSNVRNTKIVDINISKFNALLAILCWHAKFIFKNTAEKSQKILQQNQNWEYYVSSNAKEKLFTCDSQKTHNGQLAYQNWITEIYLDMRKIASQMKTPLCDIFL